MFYHLKFTRHDDIFLITEHSAKLKHLKRLVDAEHNTTKFPQRFTFKFTRKELESYQALFSYQYLLLWFMSE
jgi:hypothetical protein